MVQTLAGQLSQSQRQRLSPRMMIWTGLLARPLGELREEVKREIETNPAIDDVDLSPFYRRVGRVSPDDAQAMLENIAAPGESLDEHLMQELRMAAGEFFDSSNRRIVELAEAIIANLDEHGRFVGSIPDLMMTERADAESIERARQFVMTLDPLGCGAKSAAECLTAQLVKVPAKDRAACRQVIDHIDDLQQGKISIAEIGAESLAVFRKHRGLFAVDPGAKFAPKRVETVVPDIEVDASGDFTIETGDLPEIRVSTKYLQMSKDRSLDAETRHYAQERVRHARDLAAAIEQRHETMEQVVGVVMAAQRDFLKKGEGAIHPLTMVEVAKKAKCSVATVSRVARRKYVKTPRGTLPLRRFFARIDGEPLAKLREILSSKGGEKLSDREVSERMTAAGFPMARRTVNKYRRKSAQIIRRGS